MSSLTPKDVATVVLRALGPDVQIVNHRLEPFSKLKTGCLGTHSSLIVKIKRVTNDEDCQEETHTYFVKTLPDSAVINDFLMDEDVFTEEIHFYDKVAPLLMENYNGNRWSPLCYLASGSALVFEDLRSQSYAIPSDIILGEQYLKAALTSLARFHASSLLAEKRLDKTLKDAFPDSFEDKVFNHHSKFSKGIPVGFNAISKMVERFGMESSLVPKIQDRVWQLLRPQESQCNVVCHGDLWKNNLMFKNDATLKCIIVDYQFLRYASPVIDIGTLIYLHTTPDYRKKLELDMFEHYYWVLHDTLLKSCSKPTIPSYECFLKEYQERRLVGMVFGLLYLPAMYLPPEVLERIMNIPEKLKRWFLGDRYATIGFHLDTDPVYEKMMQNMVIELMEEAKLVFNI